MKDLYESRESSSPMITRAVAAALSNRRFIPYEFSSLQKMALYLIGIFPPELAEFLIPRVQNDTALNRQDVQQLKIDELIQQRIMDYRDLVKKFPRIVCGVGMGGATTHLCSILGAPFLPQAFVMTLKGGTQTGNVEEYVNLSMEIAKEITENNPEVMTIQHYDPIHDGWLVKRVNHLRLKLVDLPIVYKTYIKDHLEPGGEIIYLEGKANWLRYRLGERNVFQVGGWGDISSKEFLDGSLRIYDFCKKEHISADWRLPRYELEEGAESEWGTEPGLREALEVFCSEEGYQFSPIAFSDPNDFSKLAFYAAQEQFSRNGVEPRGTIVEMFSQYDPDAVANYGLLPLWLIFNTKDSAQFLNSMSSKFPKGKPVFFSSLSTFSRTPDIATWGEWEDALDGCEVIQIGARADHYPADAMALVSWQKKLNAWKRLQNRIKLSCLSGQDLKEITLKMATLDQV